MSFRWSSGIFHAIFRYPVAKHTTESFDAPVRATLGFAFEPSFARKRVEKERRNREVS